MDILEKMEKTKAWRDERMKKAMAWNLAMAKNEVNEEDEGDLDEMGVAETFFAYWPAKLKIGKKHPDPVVETASLSSVEPCDVYYKLRIPQTIIERGQLSALQLESITYAAQAHHQFLPEKMRSGFFIGDGAGVGKGRTLAGIIYENYLHGRTKALWVSVSNDLKYDSERDLFDIGASNIKVHSLNKLKYTNINVDGVIFCTYVGLIGKSRTEGTKYKTRLEQLLQWFGKDFDGVIIFDESHKAKNLLHLSSKKNTITGLTVLKLQNSLPNARIVYASATGASVPSNMAYMVRLGIWGQGTPFPTLNNFLDDVNERGIGFMELVSMDLKLRGRYIARQLSFHEVTFRIEEVAFTESFREVYDDSVKLWVEALKMFKDAVKLYELDVGSKMNIWAQFWGAHQRFFKYLCISAKVHHVVKITREAIDQGKCVVIGLQSTGEAGILKQLGKYDGEVNEFVSTAKCVFLDLVRNHFPTPDSPINRSSVVLKTYEKIPLLSKRSIKAKVNTVPVKRSYVPTAEEIAPLNLSKHNSLSSIGLSQIIYDLDYKNTSHYTTAPDNPINRSSPAFDSDDEEPLSSLIKKEPNNLKVTPKCNLTSEAISSANFGFLNSMNSIYDFDYTNTINHLTAPELQRTVTVNANCKPSSNEMASSNFPNLNALSSSGVFQTFNGLDYTLSVNHTTAPDSPINRSLPVSESDDEKPLSSQIKEEPINLKVTPECNPTSEAMSSANDDAMSLNSLSSIYDLLDYTSTINHFTAPDYATNRLLPVLKSEEENPLLSLIKEKPNTVTLKSECKLSSNEMSSSKILSLNALSKIKLYQTIYDPDYNAKTFNEYSASDDTIYESSSAFDSYDKMQSLSIINEEPSTETIKQKYLPTPVKMSRLDDSVYTSTASTSKGNVMNIFVKKSITTDSNRDFDDEFLSVFRKRKTPVQKKLSSTQLKIREIVQQEKYKDNLENCDFYNSHSIAKTIIELTSDMKQELLQKIENLGTRLPSNTLDQLINELGGPNVVAEMTGRRRRVVQSYDGIIKYESRSELNISLEKLNLTEKLRFMNGDKNIAIISEAASSGISLQSDRRVANKRRRVHITLELPWSADRATQQFGRTHRSNQVNAPEYIFLISDLAGERRFASTVAKRLESLGALTHGDRRATETRDLTQFNIDNKYGRTALQTVMQTIIGQESPLVPAPIDYKGDFFKDIAGALVGVGIVVKSETHPEIYSLEKDYSNISKFLNRILGIPVELQNRLFKYFTDTLNAIINQAKKGGRFDLGILDLGAAGENVIPVRLIKCWRKYATGNCPTELHTVMVECGMIWQDAVDKYADIFSDVGGFYLSRQVRNNKRAVILAVEIESINQKNETHIQPNKKKTMFQVFRPNVGLQARPDSLADIENKFNRVTMKEAEPHWKQHYEASLQTCHHVYWNGKCKNKECKIGLRQRLYTVLAGSVLPVWTRVEKILYKHSSMETTMQVIRLKTTKGQKIIGGLIPKSCCTPLLVDLTSDAERVEELNFPME